MVATRLHIPFLKLSESLSGEPAMTITCHPDCGNGAYLFVEPNEKKEVRSLTEFFDLRAALVDIQKSCQRSSQEEQKEWRRDWN